MQLKAGMQFRSVDFVDPDAPKKPGRPPGLLMHITEARDGFVFYAPIDIPFNTYFEDRSQFMRTYKDKLEEPKKGKKK